MDVSQQLGQLQGQMQGVQDHMEGLQDQQRRDHDSVRESMRKNDHDARDRDQAIKVEIVLKHDALMAKIDDLSERLDKRFDDEETGIDPRLRRMERAYERLQTQASTSKAVLFAVGAFLMWLATQVGPLLAQAIRK